MANTDTSLCGIPIHLLSQSLFSTHSSLDNLETILSLIAAISMVILVTFVFQGLVLRFSERTVIGEMGCVSSTERLQNFRGKVKLL